MNFKRSLQLPSILSRFINIIAASKALEASKEKLKDDPQLLAAAKDVLGNDKCAIVVSRNHLVQVDINPQTHADYDPTSSHPAIRAIVAAKQEVAAAGDALQLATAKLRVAIAEGKAAKVVDVTSKDTVRVEILSSAKLPAIRAKYGPQIAAIRKPADATIENE